MQLPQEFLNVIAHSQATLQHNLKEMNSMAWVNGMVMWGTGCDDLLRMLDAVLGRSDRVRLHVIVCKSA